METPDANFHEHFMRLAIAEALKAREADEVPAGCAIIRLKCGISGAPTPEDAEILALAHNSTETRHNPTAHAEMLAIAKAAEVVGDFRLSDSILYVTKEPCAMCAGAIVLARIPVVVWGMSDPARGGNSAFGVLSSPALIHRAQIVPGILEAETASMMKDFFAKRRIEAKQGRCCQ